MVAAYQADPLCHDRISARLARFIADGGPATVARGALERPRCSCGRVTTAWCSPQAALPSPAAPPGVVQSQCFEALWHELFNERDAAPVFAALHQWLAGHFRQK